MKHLVALVATSIALGALVLAGCHRDLSLAPRCELRPDLPGCSDASADSTGDGDETDAQPNSDAQDSADGAEATATSDVTSDAVDEAASDSGGDGSVDAGADTSICAAGERRCASGKAQACNSTRSGWDEEVCALGCEEGACVEVRDLVGGAGHFCALLSNGTLRCWGSNAYGAIGAGAEAFWKPVEIPGVKDVVQVGIGGAASMVRLKDGTLKWWGWVSLPTGGAPVEKVPPTNVPGVAGVTDMAFSGYHACVRFADGTVKCWGENDYGQLGDGTTISVYPPSFVTPRALVSPIALYVGDRQTFALLAGSPSEGRGWGNSSYSELGVDISSWSKPYATEPVPTYGYATQIAARYSPTCARYADGTVKCSAENTRGEAGDGTKERRWTPVLVKGLSGVTEVRVGVLSACALLSGGTVTCWGSNTYGQLGDGTQTDSAVPVAVPSAALSGVRRIAIGSGTTCALIGKSRIKCWGSNGAGALGANLDPATNESRLTPLEVVW